ncbi:MarR family winged helix-turn-helix transcriptional regulator [Microbacterium sp. HD4P20]|uniref:MarR family winged helix-turn-helix transcriptional regulator n=1 Tax=Microbacterium sp. HD4P20 TaxID=2864874 RepID=UPI0020A3A01A|nr:MarR family winged helix-turn-helix transcriptional regulator [Microbacterium sp. HD4P20]MCP2638178.1 MarR family winged helix-turn-helix transcriptional regulator [Microbacterium sp. HD4P20]
MPSRPDDPADAIAAALARLRGRRMPRPPWGDGPPPPAGGHAGPHPAGTQGVGHHPFPHGGGRGGPPWGRGHGGPPWGAPRIGGPARMRLLEALAAASHPLSVGEIADAVGVDQPRASRLVQQSVELDLVRREADPDDARRTRVALTDAGSRLVRGFRGERRNAMDAALTAFTDDERAELARLLTKLADSWPQR